MSPQILGAKDKYTVAGSALGAAGAAGIAALGSLCCVGPAVIAVLGASGAVAAASLEPFRPYFLLAAFALLGFGFWRVYLPRRAPEGAVCSIRTGRGVRATLWISLVITVAATVLPFFVSLVEVT